jgi:hypothetical protein
VLARPKATRLWPVLVRYALLTLPLVLPQAAAAFELEPNEYVPAPAGTTALFNYFFYGDDQSYHPVGGTTTTHGTHLTETVGISRATQFFNVGPFEMLAEILQPYGALTGASIAGTNYKSTSGLGDTTLAVAGWPYKNMASLTFIGIGTYITLPDGEYNPMHAINLGGNRMVYDPQLALHQGFDPQWSIDLTADYILYGNNTNTGAPAGGSISQHATTQLQGFLNYAWDTRTTTSLGYEGELGGRQYLNGAGTAAKTEFQEIRFVTSYSVTPAFQILGEVNHQFQNVGGFKQDLGVTLRALYTF